MFFSFEGLDGAGKSTQLGLFVDWLREQGKDVVACRDPGGTPLGEAVRKILLDGRSIIGRRAEMLLYMAARTQLVEEVIAPALAAGSWVVSDRFLLSNVVYQGHAGGLHPADVWQIGRYATKEVAPDLTFVLDIAADEAARRIHRLWDRMEQQGDDFRRQVRQGFLREAAKDPQRIAVIDASGTIAEVQAAIRAAAKAKMQL
jgi:dTMP kinase